MITPRPTAEPTGSVPGVDELAAGSAPELPSWLPDEATLNRLAGEFFAALPGTASGAGSGAVPAAPPADSGRIEHAPRVDVPARSKEVSRVPGGAQDGGAAAAVTPTPPSVAADLPGLSVTDPEPASGFAPGRAVPDVSEAATAVQGAAGLGLTVPEGPIVPGLTGVQLGSPGELTPQLPGLAEPRPDEGIPSVPTSDQLAGAMGVPGGSPDVATAAAVPGGFDPPVAPPAAPFDVVALQVPLPGGEQLPPLSGLGAPLPSAGLPGLPASDQLVTGAGLPDGPPDVTVAAAALTGAELGPLPVGPADGARPPDDLGGPTAIPAAPEPPVDAAEAVSQAPVAAPFTPASGLRAPGLPSVPALPADSAGAIPGTPQELPDTAESIGPAPFAVDPAMIAPAVPQPPLPVPEPPGAVPAPSTPYYFLAESSPYRGDLDRDLDPGGDRLAALADAALHPPGVGPAQVNVPALDPAPTALFDPSAGLARLPSAGSVPAAAGGPAYYFADRVEPAADRVRGPVRGAAPEPAGDRHPPFDVRLVRRDFPILAERVNGQQLVWFDNAATTQKPQAVIDRLAHFYRHENSNIHRAAHELAARSTDAYEGARKTVARFLGAESEKNIVFVRGATEAINLVAKSWGRANIRRGDEIVVSHLEHHANIVPWQQLIAETGAKLRVIPVDDTGQLLLPEYARLLGEKTKLVAVTQVSNALGTVTPVDAVVEMAHRAGACVLIDGAQSVPHLRVDMQALGADFFVFSGHKIYGPTGIGVLYGRTEVLESMPPWEGGGNMIADVTFERTVFQHPPARFEAGTGNIADAVGLGAALDYVTRIGLETIAQYEHSLLEYATPRMRAVPGLRLIGTARDKASVLSFVLDGYRTEEVGAALNQRGIAVRSGHHCAQPILRRFGLEATVRPSIAFYNTTEEIDRMVAVLHRLAADRGRR